MALWKPYRGNRADLDAVAKHDGYIYFCIDDGSLFFDYTDAGGVLQRKQINAKDAETLTGISLEEIKKSISYNDLTDKPTIPTKTSQLTNDSGFKTTDNNTTYSISKSGSTITLTGSDGSTTSVTDADTNTTYSTATSSTAGLVKIGYAENGKNYPVELSDGKMFVNVPWTDNNTTYSNFVKSGSGAKAGLVPAPSTTAGTTKYLREDGTWAVPPDNNTTYSAAGSALGLVKSGGDVTISDGVITVNDDSHNHTISNVDGLQAALDKKMSIETTNGNYLNTKTYIAHHPENGNGSIIPFLYNDLGHLLSKGGSCEIYTTSSTNFTATSLTKVKTLAATANLFDGTPSYQTNFSSIFSDGTGSATNTVDTLVIDITCHKAFPYGTTFYIDFGSANWIAPNIKILVMRSGTVKTGVTSTDTVYTQKVNITNNSLPCYYTTAVGNYTCKGTDGGTHQGFNKLRIVLEKPRRTLRIAQIGIINYGSSGVSETYLSRVGGTLYGSLTPYSNKGGNLGSSSKQWNAVYGGTIYENGDTLSSKYATKTELTTAIASAITTALSTEV